MRRVFCYPRERSCAIIAKKTMRKIEESISVKIKEITNKWKIYKIAIFRNIISGCFKEYLNYIYILIISLLLKIKIYVSRYLKFLPKNLVHTFAKCSVTKRRPTSMFVGRKDVRYSYYCVQPLYIYKSLKLLNFNIIQKYHILRVLPSFYESASASSLAYICRIV